jgi:putative glutamine amidotransferase
MQPRILILGLDTDDDYLRTYAAAVAATGGLPERRWLGESMRRDESGVEAFLKDFHGVLLPGGEDLDPALYGESPHPGLGTVIAELDAGQMAAARVLLKLDIPVLGICRGMQVLGVAVGGSLIQDLPSQRPSPVEHRIKEPKDFPAHMVEAVPGSRVALLCGAERFMVNSRHHQAVRAGEGASVGPFRITARAADGVAEAMEAAGRPFLVGVQWHPENMVGGDPRARGLFEGFIAAAGIRAGR